MKLISGDTMDPKQLFAVSVKITRGTDRVIMDLVKLGAFHTKSELIRTAITFFLKEAGEEIRGIYQGD